MPTGLSPRPRQYPPRVVARPGDSHVTKRPYVRRLSRTHPHLYLLVGHITDYNRQVGSCAPPFSLGYPPFTRFELRYYHTQGGVGGQGALWNTGSSFLYTEPLSPTANHYIPWNLLCRIPHGIKLRRGTSSRQSAQSDAPAEGLHGSCHERGPGR